MKVLSTALAEYQYTGDAKTNVSARSIFSITGKSRRLNFYFDNRSS